MFFESNEPFYFWVFHMGHVHTPKYWDDIYESNLEVSGNEHEVDERDERPKTPGD